MSLPAGRDLSNDRRRSRAAATGTLAILLLAAVAAVRAEPLRPVAVADVRIEGGFWGPRIDTNAKVTLPHNLGFIEKTGRMAAFDRAAGEPTDAADNAVSVVDSDVHKILEGAAYTMQLRPHEVDAGEVARQVARVIAAQEDDGFLCPRLTAKGRDFRWADLHKSHVLYSAGHLFESGVAWRQATGNDDLLGASTRFADLIDGRFGPGKVLDVPGHQEIELALVRLYQATGEARYLDLCRFFLDQRGCVHDSEVAFGDLKPRAADYNQDRVRLKDAAHAVGHAVRAGYTYAAMADVERLRPGHGYGPALDRLWEDVVDRKLYLTGASATARYYDEGFGDPYVLPNDTAYAETCGTIATALWAHRMALLHGDARYADILERALYNGVLSGISLSGDKFFYKNPLASRGDVRRYESWDPACCQSNLVRIIPQVGAMAYATQGNTAYVNLFVAGTASLKLEAGEFRVRLETDYPFDGRLRFVVEAAPDAPVTLALRIPGWALEKPVPGTLYRFAGKRGGDDHRIVAAMPDESGYLRINRQWEPDHVFELPLPMPVRRVLADDRVEADRGKVALQRGPLVYCVEAIDHDGRRTDALVLPDEAKLYVDSGEGLFRGQRIIRADAVIVREPAWGKAVEEQPVKLTAIPYYAWANRGDGFMDVWLARSAEHATPLPATTLANDATVSSSNGASDKALEAIRDGREGPSSDHRPTPSFAWPESNGGTGWIQYEWTEPQELSRTAVYWAVDRRAQVYWGKRIRGTDLALPKKWRILYRDGGSWKPVEAAAPEGEPRAMDKQGDAHTLRLDLPNQVRFQPVGTTALRLEVEFGPAPCAVREWKVD